MGSGYDEVAKAIATNVPRRKVLKLLAGGVAASIGSALIGSSAAARGPAFSSTFGGDSDASDQSTIEEGPVFNGGGESFRPVVPWWSEFYPGRNNGIFINNTGPI